MLVYGFGGHARVVIDCIEAMGEEVSLVFDDDPQEPSKDYAFYTARYSHEHQKDDNLVIGIGDNSTRKKIALKVSHPIGKVIHPTAVLSKRSLISHGTVVFQSSVIQTGAKIGKHCIINTSASVDHDCDLQDFVQIGPNATLCGNVKVGEGSFVGAGATVIQGIKIGSWAMVGAGAVVTRDVPSGVTVLGVPARQIKS